MAWVKTCRDCDLTFASGEVDRNGRCGACRRAAAAEIAAAAAVRLDRIARADALILAVGEDDLRTLEEMRKEGGWSSLGDLVTSIVHEVCADERAAEGAS